MTTEQIIEALQTLENFQSREPLKIHHYKGEDEIGPYEYFAMYSKPGDGFSTPDLHSFINDVIRRWDY